VATGHHSATLAFLVARPQGQQRDSDGLKKVQTWQQTVQSHLETPQESSHSIAAVGAKLLLKHGAFFLLQLLRQPFQLLKQHCLEDLLFQHQRVQEIGRDRYLLHFLPSRCDFLVAVS
jgi:hypothetical protein